VLGQVVLEPTDPDFAASVPDGVRVAVVGDTDVARHSTSDPDQGALGGGDAVRVAPPVDLNLVAYDIASGDQLPLPDGVRQQTFRVSLPVLATPDDPADTFTWLASVRQDDAPAGYMRYPSTYNSDTGMLVFEMPVSVLENTAVLPVILQKAWVQAFMPDVHIWSSPFHDGQDLGPAGQLWDTYEVIAPQVATRIGVVAPDTGDMVWIDADGVGPTGTPGPSDLSVG
jgi:hypothetical protein